MLIQGRSLVSDSAAQQYWTASRCRLDRWSTTIKKAASQMNRGQSPVAVIQLRAVAEEILASEILTRVMAAVARLYDKEHGIEHLSPVAESVYHGHLEARHQVLHLIAHGPGLGPKDAVDLNRLRRRCERWTDMLVGYLSGLGDVEAYVFDSERARELPEDLSYGRRESGGPATWAMLSASLKTIFQPAMSEFSPCAELNEQIASAVMACYPADAFDGTGVASGQWLSRLSRATGDTQRMIDAFFRDGDDSHPIHMQPSPGIG